MIKRLDPFILIGFLIIGIPLLAATITACVTSTQEEVDDPTGGFYKVDGITVHEIHPKPGITCFVVYNNGISCIKD